jgi:hypothetical protein
MKTIAVSRWAISACGLLGVAALAVYYSVPLPLPPAGATIGEIVSFGSRYHDRILLDAWLQAVGSLLAVVFFVAVVHLAGGFQSVAGWITLVGSSAVLAMSLLDVTVVLGSIQGAAAGHLTTAVVCFDLTYVFIHIFPIAPAPATFGGLGGVLLQSSILPKGFAYTALALAVAFESLGFAGLFKPSVNGAMVLLLSSQELWIVAAALVLLVRPAASPSTSWRERETN